MNTNQDTTLTNQDAFNTWKQNRDKNDDVIFPVEIWQAATKASESEINSLKERVAELELTVKKWQENSVDLEYKCLDKNLQIAELQADNERLREALERLDGWLEVRHLGGLMPNEKELLKTTTAQSLAEHENEVIERCAKVCEYYAVNTFNSSSRNAAIELAVAIRNIENEKLEGK